MTPGGQIALDIAEWAWEDPAGRVSEAISRVHQMAALAEGQELNEIQDAGTMLHRLAGTLDQADTGPVIGEDTILQQLSGDTITSQLVELANDAWRTERRGRGGQWVGPGGEIKKTAQNAARLRRMQAAQARHSSSGQAVPAIGSPNRAIAVAARAHAEQVVQAKLAEARKQADDEAGKKAKLKLATEAGLAVTGGMLAYIANKMGAPDVAAIAATVGPFLIQVIIEFFKRI